MNNNVDQNTTTTTYTGVVYSYTNTTAGDEYGYRYIGTTSNEYVRKSLWNSSKTKRYAGDKVNGARKRYGIASFKYEILATIQCSDPEELKIELEKEEAKYIRQYNSIEKGYNMSSKAVGGGYEVHLTAQGKNQALQEIYITVNKSYLPTKVRFSQKGKWTTITVSNFKAAKLSDSSFTFKEKDYPNAEVIDLR